ASSHARRVSGLVRWAKSMRSARPYTRSGSGRVSLSTSERGRPDVTPDGGDQGVEDERGAAVYGARAGTGSSAHPRSVPTATTSPRPLPRLRMHIGAAFYLENDQPSAPRVEGGLLSRER